MGMCMKYVVTVAAAAHAVVGVAVAVPLEHYGNLSRICS
jgi:hypothetical protein